MSKPPTSSGSLNQPRLNRPRPPSTRPPSSAEASQEASHEIYVRIANLQMAKARQKRIRAALQDQVDTCTQEIERIERKIADLYDEAGIEATESETDNPASDNPAPSKGDDGFEYEY